MNFLTMSRIAVLASVVAVPAFAQLPAGCDPIGSVSGAIGRAQFSIERATSAVQNNGSATRDLQDVVKLLADNRTENPLARNYILGEAYMLLLTQPGISVESTRSALGLTTNPTAKINLFASADSAFNVVEKMAPACVGLITQWRQHKPWINTLNASFNALNAGSLDSAEFYAKRALIIEHRAPYAYSVLGSVAAQRKDYAAAKDYWNKSLALSTDTAYADVRLKTMFEMADAASAATNAAAGTAKVALAREAITAWQNYLGASNDDYRIAETIDRLAVLYKTAGDSASIPKIYAPILANPGKYGENTLIHAGVAATRAGRPMDAITLLEGASAINPYSRDAMYNLALTYFGTNQPEKMFPIVKNLVTMDPSNPDDQLLYAFAYQALYKAHSKDAKLKRIYTDSLIYFNKISEDAPVKVSVTDFIRGEKETTLGGTIENRSTTTKSYTLSLDFLDKSGAVVGSQDIPVGPVAAHQTQKFRLTIPKGGVYGFRYKPVR